MAGADVTLGMLQSSPYLTCARPGSQAPVTYVSDTRVVEYPVMSDPGRAAFGVIGLDRTVVWHDDANALMALEEAAAQPVERAELERRFGAGVVADLVRRSWLQHPDDLCREYWLRTGQIEVTAHCNWGCRFCPVSVDPKAPETMPMDLFTEIIEKLSGYVSVRFVTFHFFNEPTLDRFFDDRIRVLREHGMKLSLSTNASTRSPRPRSSCCVRAACCTTSS